ncbi:hypothetical protein [Pontibacter anaerobius]|uniref:hypothetical protein n=1 Tax=Pontibacter anaerobius TaxID=2993940 RepID=UPI003F72C83C
MIQLESTMKAGVCLWFIRDLEQGKETLRLNKVNQVLQLFGHQTGPVLRTFHIIVSWREKAEIQLHKRPASWLMQDENR